MTIIFALLLGLFTGDMVADRVVTKDERSAYCGKLYSQHYDFVQCVKQGAMYMDMRSPDRKGE